LEPGSRKKKRSFAVKKNKKKEALERLKELKARRLGLPPDEVLGRGLGRRGERPGRGLGPPVGLGPARKAGTGPRAEMGVCVGLNPKGRVSEESSLRRRGYLVEGVPSPGTVDIDSAVYQKRERVPKISVPVSPAKEQWGGKAGAQLLQRRLAGWSKSDHRQAVAKLEKMEVKVQKQYERELDAAAQKLWGRSFQAGDYRISCVGSDKFSEKHKEKLRDFCRRKSHIKGALSSHKYLIKKL
jgi:hypothetical protein